MRIDIINQLKKVYDAVINADDANESRAKPNPTLRNKLITIKQIVEELLNNYNN